MKTTTKSMLKMVALGIMTVYSSYMEGECKWASPSDSCYFIKLRAGKSYAEDRERYAEEFAKELANFKQLKKKA